MIHLSFAERLHGEDFARGQSEDAMSGKVDLYDGEYGNYEADVYRQVRIETYGVDFGQTSWVTTEESTRIPRVLELTGNSSVLEIGCGSGAYALHLAQTTGCSITGLDINALGIHNANQLASRRGLSPQAQFEVCDVSKPLPFANETFDAIFSNDVLCHIPGRPALLAEMYRVLKPGGSRMLFSDALIIGGIISHDEVATRSSIGYYLFSPPGENERLILQAGFTDLKVEDTTDEAVGTATRWHQARQKYKDQLLALEGEQKYSGLQRFLSCVQTLTEERRLLRLLYQARKA
jgi:cyclopropane fatty-acyl-phospholipid synthase-like methyltransferase